jgi:RND superfamily putative drug exporter
MHRRRTNLAGRIGRWSAHHRKTAIIGWMLFVVLAYMAGGAVGTKQLTEQEAGVGESGTASKVVHDSFEKADDEMVLISDGRLTADSRQFHAAVDDVVGRLKATEGVDRIQAPYGDEGRISKDRHTVMVSFRIKGDVTDPAVTKIVDRTVDETAAVQRAHPELTVEEFGNGSSEEAFTKIFQDDMAKAGAMSLPITLVVLVFAFGALLVAGIPVLLAITAVLATLGLVGPLSQIAPVDESISHVVLLIGLAVGVDYSLFYLRRAREEKAAGRSTEEAIDAAAATSGHSVLVSGLTVMVSMAGMYLAGAPTFVSFATGTILVVASAMIASLTVLPALLSLMGDRIHKPGRIPGVQALKRVAGRISLWSRVIDAVTRRPKLWGGLAATVLVAMAIPAAGMDLGNPPMADSLPKDEPVVQTFNRLRDAFPVEGTGVSVVVKAADIDAPAVQHGFEELERLAAQQPRLFPGEGLDVEVNDAGTVAAVGLEIAGDGSDATSNAALDAVRDELVPEALGGISGVQTWVDGQTAQERDFNDTLVRNLPYVFGFVLLAAFGLLLVTFRSIVIPVKAVVLNLMSVAAAYGAMVLVFQHGWFKNLLGFQETGPIIAWIPMFLFVVLFGLSMDYHVFILSRVREAYDRGMRTQDAVGYAIRNTAGVVTSAAVVMVAVFAVFGSLSFIVFKQLGVGLAIAVLLDATLIRGVLLPASMQLLGERNWWLPRSLGWLPKPAVHDPEPAPARG